MEENNAENPERETSKRDYHTFSEVDMVSAWRCGCIANRHLNPEAERRMRIRAYEQQNKT